MLAYAMSKQLAWSGLQKGGLRQTGSAPSFRYRRSLAQEDRNDGASRQRSLIKVCVAIAMSRCFVVLHFYHTQEVKWQVI
jgi:hypothetical protein